MKTNKKVAGVEKDSDGTFLVWDVEAVQIIGYGFKSKKTATKTATDAGYEVR